MAGLVPAILAAPLPASPKLSGGFTTWMIGTNPVMTSSGSNPSVPFPPRKNREGKSRLAESYFTAATIAASAAGR
jgi:hypothetical protein